MRFVSFTDEGLPFISRTGKTRDMTKIKGWKNKFIRSKETSQSNCDGEVCSFLLVAASLLSFSRIRIVFLITTRLAALKPTEHTCLLRYYSLINERLFNVPRRQDHRRTYLPSAAICWTSTWKAKPRTSVSGLLPFPQILRALWPISCPLKAPAT